MRAPLRPRNPQRAGATPAGYEVSFWPPAPRRNQIMLEPAGIDANARVLDLGWGNGNTSTWLCQATAAHVTGIDRGGVRIANAIASPDGIPEPAARLELHKA